MAQIIPKHTQSWVILDENWGRSFGEEMSNSMIPKLPEIADPTHVNKNNKHIFLSTHAQE